MTRKSIKKSSSKLTTKFKKAASSKRNNIHVVPGKSGWSVRKEGSLRASSNYSTKAEAIKGAKNFKSGDNIIIHGKDGKIQSNRAKN